MKNLIIALSVMLLLCQCNKESFVENQGFISTVGNNPTNNVGKVTIFTKNDAIGFCSNGLQITINGVNQGVISTVNYSNPTCGINGATACSLTLPVGSYACTVKGTGTFCPKYTFSVLIEKGKCSFEELE